MLHYVSYTAEHSCFSWPCKQRLIDNALLHINSSTLDQTAHYNLCGWLLNSISKFVHIDWYVSLVACLLYSQPTIASFPPPFSLPLPSFTCVQCAAMAYHGPWCRWSWVFIWSSKFCRLVIKLSLWASGGRCPGWLHASHILKPYNCMLAPLDHHQRYRITPLHTLIFRSIKQGNTTGRIRGICGGKEGRPDS